MESLLNVLKKELQKYNEEGLIDAIKNREKAAEYIYRLLKEDLDLPCDKFTIESIKGYFENRINHVLFTFAIGLLLAKFKELDKYIEQEYKKYFEDKRTNIFKTTWLISSLYHDYGYFMLNNEKYKEIKTLNDFKVEKSIFDYKNEENEASRLYGLDDYIEPEKSRYSKKLFENYFEWKIKAPYQNERFEHGIAGGYVLFDDISNENANPNTQVIKRIKTIMGINADEIKNDMFYQNICYRIMEHNIWTIDIKKESNESSFDMSKLEDIFTINFKKITVKEPLLYLLSLSDTIEFSKRIESQDDTNFKINIEKLLEEIQIEIEKDHIYINTSLINKTYDLEKLYNGIKDLNNWVDINSSISNGFICLE